MKKALILNISYLEEDMINALKDMGYFVIGTGNNPQLKGKTLVNKYVQGDFSDREKTLQLAKKEKIDAIVSCGNDFGVLTAAYIAEKMGLKGHDSLSNAIILHHKDAFKQFAKEFNIITPVAEQFSVLDDAINFLQACNEYPLMVKPIDLSAGNGITKANNLHEGIQALRLAFKKSKEKKIIIEPFIEGTLNACCVFLINKKAAVICSNNEYCNINPYRVDMALYPADNFHIVRDVLIDQIEKMADTLNLEDGIFSIQYIYKDREIKILEGMRRVLGNFYMKAATMANDFDWNYWQAFVQAGNTINDISKNVEQKGFYAYKAIMALKSGTINSIFIPERIRKYVVFEYDLRYPGEVIVNNLSEPIKFLILKFDDRNQMERIMVEKYDDIKVIID